MTTVNRPFGFMAMEEAVALRGPLHAGQATSLMEYAKALELQIKEFDEAKAKDLQSLLEASDTIEKLKPYAHPRLCPQSSTFRDGDCVCDKAFPGPLQESSEDL